MASKKHRVHIQNETGVSWNTKLTDADTGEAIPGVFRIVVIDVHDAVKAQIEAYATVDVVAEAEITTICPYCKKSLEEENGE